MIRDCTSRKRPGLIIFDCDGVLVDTETIANQCLSDFFSHDESQLSPAACRRLFPGRTMEEVCQEASRQVNITYSAGMVEEVRREIVSRLSEGVKPIPGAVELVHLVKDSGIPFCVASAGSVRKMHLTLGQTGLLPVLKDHLFSAQDIGRGKPHPDVFLAAAEAKGVECRHAAIIEDSVNGVLAGVAAGARVLGYAGDEFNTSKDLCEAGAEVIHHLDEAASLLNLSAG